MNVRDNVDAVAPSTTTSVRVSTLLTALEKDAKAEVARVAGTDGFVTQAEANRLVARWRDNMAALQPFADPPSATAGGSVFGIAGTVPASKVKVTPMLRGLSKPTGVALNPHKKSLWIVNSGNDSSVVVEGFGTRNARVLPFKDTSDHFMMRPMALAFSRGKNEMVTVQESMNDYNGKARPNFFMGPTLWDADLRYYDGDAPGHYDMLHHSPLAMGVAAGRDNNKREYWVFNGLAGSIDRYFFNKPHAHGTDDHRDGETLRYATGQLKRVAGVPSNMVWDPATDQLFIADTGNKRIAVLDTKESSRGQAFRAAAYHGETPLLETRQPNTKTLVPASAGLGAPSGLILHNNHLVVGDYATGKIRVYTKAGQLKGELDTGLGRNTLTGITAGPKGELLALDARGGRLVQINVG